jgi:proline-specific peptidase
MFLTVGGQRIFFDVVGDKLAIEGQALREKPTLLVLHGGPGFDHSTMRPDFDRFADLAQVVYLDHRGNGRSVPSDPSTWTLARWGDDVRAVCDALGIERPIVLGQSFGGMVAQSYLTRHPSHPRAVILSSTAARIDLPASFDLFEKKGGPEARAIAERFWRSGTDEESFAYLRVCMPLYNTTLHPDRDDAFARAILRLEVYRHFSLPGGELHRMDFRADLSRVACPVLVLGGIEDPITPPHLARELAGSIAPGLADLHLFERTGHGAFRDDPEPVFDVIRRFIGRLPAPTPG